VPGSAPCPKWASLLPLPQVGFSFIRQGIAFLLLLLLFCLASSGLFFY